jgi:hypothetical protein
MKNRSLDALNGRTRYRKFPESISAGMVWLYYFLVVDIMFAQFLLAICIRVLRMTPSR